MRNLNRSAYTYRRFRQQNKVNFEAEKSADERPDKLAVDSAKPQAFSGLNYQDQSCLLNALPYGALLIGRHGEILLANNAFRKICANLLNGDKLEHTPAIHLLTKLGVDSQTGENCLPPCDIRASDGRTISCKTYPLETLGNALISEVWLFEDITEELAAASQLVYLAEHDVLTGLYNRHRFQEELVRQIKSAQRHEKQLALLFIDLDNFKIVNDTLGHRGGDELLKNVAQGIAAQVRGDEFLARVGGDEFSILIPEANIDDVHALIERIRQIVSQTPCAQPVNELSPSCSIGVAFYPQDAANEKELMAKADAAMYRIKEAGRDAEPEHHAPVKKKVTLRRRAVAE